MYPNQENDHIFDLSSEDFAKKSVDFPKNLSNLKHKDLQQNVYFVVLFCIRSPISGNEL